MSINNTRIKGAVQCRLLLVLRVLRVLNPSAFVARNLSGCHIALGGQYEADTSATGDTEDAI